MSEEASQECPAPPTRIEHEFETPIVDELPRGTSPSARERADAAERNTSGAGTERSDDAALEGE